MAELAKSPIGSDDLGGDQFAEIHRAEIGIVRKRRKELGRGGAPLEPKKGTTVFETVGLALSGGGVRSAAFALGALQALDHHNALNKVDYLSTVSGGGYMGSSLSATMTMSKGKFVYRGETGPTGDLPVAGEISDTEAVGHIRDHSNYLIPGGIRDVLTGAAIVLRGLVANAVFILPVVLLLAALTIWFNPNRSSFSAPDFLGTNISLAAVYYSLAVIYLCLLLLWTLYRSFLSPSKLSEFRTRIPVFAAIGLVILLAAFAVELNLILMAPLFATVDDGGLIASLIGYLINFLVVVGPAIAAVVVFFRQQLGDFIQIAEASSGFGARLVSFLSRAVLWVAGLVVPVLIWLGYFYLVYWGTVNDLRVVAASGTHTPHWLLLASQWCSNFLFGYVVERPVALAYVSLAVLLQLLSFFLSPNSYSLHRLYRDRLSRAFLFHPGKYAELSWIGEKWQGVRPKREFAPLDTMRLSDLLTVHAPYHLINTALNIQGSRYANRHGRNADFFLFSPLYTGSFATGYARTVDLEELAGLDLATAMAISGAAASSNMGAKTVWPLTATLTLLNIRLGYWLRNPRYVGQRESSSRIAQALDDSGRIAKGRSSLFLWSEITGRLDENGSEVYLTDGGHIENLAIYELLRRRCRVIVCIDAEADAEMRFNSFVTLQRYARIDLGVRIDLPWDKIRACATASMGGGASPAHGPHAAVGTIDYGGGEKGYLLYIKSSLTGDENDYVRDYARRYPRFPHESTGDQFFSEEQFEVYRALAFHATHKIFDGVDGIEAAGSDKLENFKRSANASVKAVRKALT